MLHVAACSPALPFGAFFPIPDSVHDDDRPHIHIDASLLLAVCATLYQYHGPSIMMLQDIHRALHGHGHGRRAGAAKTRRASERAGARDR